MRAVLIVQGPNLNLLAHREQEIYGNIDLEQIHSTLRERGQKMGLEIRDFQANHEGEIVDAVHRTRGRGVDAIIINPATYTHTSVAIPYFEVHISNIHCREEFRKGSLTADGASGIVAGF